MCIRDSFHGVHAGRLVDLPEQQGDAHGHQNAQHRKDGQVVGAEHLARDLLGQKHLHGAQHQHAAHGAHQVDDRVALAAQGFGRHVGHQGHGGAAVGSHGDQHTAQPRKEQHKIVLPLGQGQNRQTHHGRHRAAHNVRHTPAHTGAGLVAEFAEQRQHEQRQHVVHGHDHADERVIHGKGLFQNQRDQVVVHLPERADGHECKAHEKGAFVIQLHREKPPLLLLLRCV